MSVPSPLVPYHRPSRCLDLIGPISEPADDPAVVGLRVDERHTNARGFRHGGTLIAVADTVMGHTAHRVGPSGITPPTASLTTSFPSSAQHGDWVPGAAVVRRAGRHLAFTVCEFTTNHRVILVASGVCPAAGPPDR